MTISFDDFEKVDIRVGEVTEVEDFPRARNPSWRLTVDLGPELAVVKLGPEGVLGATRDDQVVVPPIPVEVVNGLGAGDAFGGALCHALLSGWPLERTLRFANAAGALVASRLGCADDMGTADEIEALLSSRT